MMNEDIISSYNNTLVKRSFILPNTVLFIVLENRNKIIRFKIFEFYFLREKARKNNLHFSWVCLPGSKEPLMRLALE